MTGDMMVVGAVVLVFVLSAMGGVERIPPTFTYTPAQYRWGWRPVWLGIGLVVFLVFIASGAN